MFRERIRQQMENQTTTEEDSYEQFLVKKDVQFLEKIDQVIEENMDDSDLNIDTIASGIGDVYKRQTIPCISVEDLRSRQRDAGYST